MIKPHSSLWSWLRCHFLGETSPDPQLGHVPRPKWWSPPSTSPFTMHNTIVAVSYLMVSSPHWMWGPSLRAEVGSVLIQLLATGLSAWDLAHSWQGIPRAEWINEWMGNSREIKFIRGTFPPDSSLALPLLPYLLPFFKPKAERLQNPCPGALIWKKWWTHEKMS